MLSVTHILHKTFHIQQGNVIGTGFIIELDSREYLITAKHLVPDQAGEVEIYHEKTWKALPVVKICHHPDGADVAVITVSRQIAPRYPTENSSSDTSLGEGVMMIGFPSSINHSYSDFNLGYPLPFVKAAIVSNLATKNGIRKWYFDGHNHSGFSGGPIIASQRPSGDPNLGTKIIGIEVGYSTDFTCAPIDVPRPLSQVKGRPVTMDHIHVTNTGFIIGIDIKHAIETIQTYPYGFLLDSNGLWFR